MAYQYIKVEFTKAGSCYQEVDRGYTLRYVDDQGNELFEQPPVNDDCRVTVAEPVPTDAMLVAGLARQSVVEAAVEIANTQAAQQAALMTYDVERDGERRSGPVDRRNQVPVIGPLLDQEPIA